MKFTRAAFATGILVGFIAGSRAGREQYDRIVKYSRMAVTSPPVQRAGKAISAKATDLAKSAATSASKAADDTAKKAKDRVAKVKAQKTPRSSSKLGRPSWRSRTDRSATPPMGTQPSANGGKRANSHNG
jgi:hypothetical protein